MYQAGTRPTEPEPEPEGSEARGLGFLPEHAVEFSDKIIGRGGQGIVTEGRYTAPDGTTRAVAIKKLADGATDREEAQFLKEFETHKRASRNCDKACTLYGCVYRGAALCLVMERYERSLYQFLDERRDPSVPDDPKVPAVQAALMANEIAHGLSQLHRSSIVCADLKPGNVLMDRDGGLVISDFGLAIMVDRSIMRSASSRSGAGAGVTYRYASPEQLDSDSFGAMDTKADLWALGCIVVEMLTGEPVWSGKREMEIMMNVAGKRKSPPIPDGVPDELQAALRECFVHDQAKRSSADDFIATLRPIVEVEQRRRDDEARAAAALAAAAAASTAGAQAISIGGGLPVAYQGTIDLLSRQAQPTVGAQVDHNLRVEMEKRGLSATQQAVLLRDGVGTVGALQLLEEEDFRLLGIHLMPPSTSPGAAPAPAAVASPQEKAELHDLLSDEGRFISEAGRVTLLDLIGNLTQLCQLSLQTMQAIGLNAVDRRLLANLTLKPGTCVLKNFLVLKHASHSISSISVPGIRMLAVQHQCHQYEDILGLDFSVAQGFQDPSDQAKIGSLILTSGSTEELSTAAQRVLQQAGHTTAAAVAALDATALIGLRLPHSDASLLLTRGQTAKISLTGLQILADNGKLTLDDVHPLKTADARDLGLITEDCYEINTLRAHDSTLPPPWKLPPPSGAAAWVPRGGGGGGGGGMALHAEPELLDEMVKRGFLPSEQALLVSEGVLTVDDLSLLTELNYKTLGINTQQATQRAQGLQQVDAAERENLRHLLATEASGIDHATRQNIVDFAGSIDSTRSMGLHVGDSTHTTEARKLGLTVMDTRRLYRALAADYAIASRTTGWQQHFAQELERVHKMGTAGAAALVAAGCAGISEAQALVADAARVAPLGLSAADVAAAKAARICFTKVGSTLQAGGDTVTGQGRQPNGNLAPGGAVCADSPMCAGQHYAEFTHASGNYPNYVHIGVVEAGYDPAAAQQPIYGNAAAGAWMLDFNSGQLCHRSKGMPSWGGQQGESTKGGTLGLLLDLNDGSLAVYKGGQRVGLAVPPGNLVGPLCWAADVRCCSDRNAATHHGAVRIATKPVP